MTRSSKSDRRSVRPRTPRRQILAAARARRLRGAILELLDEQAPERVDADVLLGVLERLHYDVTARALAAELDYLQQRGYLEFDATPPKLRGESRRLPRITGVGITDRGADLVDGTLSDPGVALE